VARGTGAVASAGQAAGRGAAEERVARNVAATPSQRGSCASASRSTVMRTRQFGRSASFVPGTFTGSRWPVTSSN